MTGLVSAVKPIDAGKAAIFKYQTKITEPGERLLAFHKKFRMNGRMSALDKALFFSQRIYETMQSGFIPMPQCWNLRLRIP